jgi:Phage small terminase subunit
MARHNPFAKQRQQNLDVVQQLTPTVETETVRPALLNLAQYQAALSVDISRLSTIKNMEEKQAVKKNMMVVYAQFVFDYVENKHNYPNDVAVQYMIWLFDISEEPEEMQAAVDLAFYLMPHQQMPNKFSRRDIQTFICDAIYDWAKKRLDDGKTALPVIDAVVAKLDGWQLSAPVQSKVLVIAAKHHNAAGNFQTVVDYCEKAKLANPEGWGAKTLLATAKQRL